MAVVEKRNERKSPEKRIRPQNKSSDVDSKNTTWCRKERGRKYETVGSLQVLGWGGEPKKEKRRDQANANALLTKSRQPQSRGTAAPPPPPATTWSNWVAEIYDDAELLILHSANPNKCHRQWPPCPRVKTTGLARWARWWVTPQKA